MGSLAPGAETKYEPLNCELRIEHCRLLDKGGKLVLPPLGKAKIVAVEGKEGWDTVGGKSKRMDLVEWLLSVAVIEASSEEEGAVVWGEEILQGLLFEEGVNWPWYCIKVGFVFESRLDLVLKHHAPLVEAGIDPQSFFPIPHPTLSPPPPAVPKKDAKPAPTTAASGSAIRSRKVELVRAKSKTAFTMKSLIKS